MSFQDDKHQNSNYFHIDKKRKGWVLFWREPREIHESGSNYFSFSKFCCFSLEIPHETEQKWRKDGYLLVFFIFAYLLISSSQKNVFFVVLGILSNQPNGLRLQKHQFQFSSFLSYRSKFSNSYSRNRVFKLFAWTRHFSEQKLWRKGSSKFRYSLGNFQEWKNFFAQFSRMIPTKFYHTLNPELWGFHQSKLRLKWN